MDRFLVHKHQQDFAAAIRRLEDDGAVLKENRALVLSFSKGCGRPNIDAEGCWSDV